MNHRARNWSLFVSVGLGVLPFGCAPEGDHLALTEPVPEDPCSSAEITLGNGIQDGDELRAIFDCVNRGGQFDSLVATMDAMQQNKISDGKTTVLDMWADILNEEVANAKDSGVSVNTADLVKSLDDLIALLNEGWLPDVIDLAGQALDNGVVEPVVPLLGKIGEPIVALQNTNQYDAYLNTLVGLLCPGLDANGQCSGNVQQLYRGLGQANAAYGTPDYPLPDGEQTTALLAGLLAPAGDDEATNQSLNQALGRGVARLGSTSFLDNTLGRWVPALYGDNPSTPAQEGYESYDARKSALYGILSLMGSSDVDPDTGKTFQDEMQDMVNALGPLVSNYYVWSPGNTKGQTGKPPSGTCDPKHSGNFSADNPAYYGLDQILRLLKGADVNYDAPGNTACAATLEAALSGLGLAYGTQYYDLELSGTTNIASLLLEIFAQLPEEDVVKATDSASYVASALTAVNSLCHTNILPDDYEALQASVHISAVIGPTLKLMKAVNHAGQIDTLKDLIVGLYDTHALCEMQPWLQQAAVKNGPLVDAVPLSAPLLPGHPYHEVVMVPLLKTLDSMNAATASQLLSPIEEGLAQAGPDVGDLTQGLGKLALAAQKEAAAGKTPALYELGQIMKDLGAYDPNYTAIASVARAVQEQIILTGLLETLAVPDVQTAMTVASGDAESPVQYLSGVVNSGDLLNTLYMLRGLLEEIDNQIKNPSSGDSSGQ